MSDKPDAFLIWAEKQMALFEKQISNMEKGNYQLTAVINGQKVDVTQEELAERRYMLSELQGVVAKHLQGWSKPRQ